MSSDPRRKNMLKAQRTKASRQREQRKKIQEYTKKIRNGESVDEEPEFEEKEIVPQKKSRRLKTKKKQSSDSEELPPEKPKLVRNNIPGKYPYSSESESSDNEELVIQSRKIKKEKSKNKSNKNDHVYEELAELKEMVSQLTEKKRKPRARKASIPDYHTEPVQQYPQQAIPVVHIHNSTATPPKETEAEKKLKETLLKFD